MKPIGNILHDLLRENPHTTRVVAELIGTTTGSMSNVFTGKSELSVDLALKFEKVFGEGKASEWLHYQVDYLLWTVQNEE